VYLVILGERLKKRLSGPWEIEEVGCQAYEQFSKRDNCWGLIPKGVNCSYSALRLPVWPIAESLEGKWGIQGIVEQSRGTLPWVGHACGE
jgi:hypothetical protein